MICDCKQQSSQIILTAFLRILSLIKNNIIICDYNYLNLNSDNNTDDIPNDTEPNQKQYYNM